MRAMILAAGYGTRLWPLTIDRAKPAIPFMGRPLVGYVAEYLARFGCREVVVNLHHRAESVRAALGDGSDYGVNLRYVEESDILGTSGALDNARELLEGGTFIVINGKLATDIDLHAALQTHRQSDALATLVLRPNPARERYSMVETRDGFVRGFGGMPAPFDDDGGLSHAITQREPGEAPPQNEPGASPLMFTGIQILESRIFSYIPRGIFSHSTTDVYPQAIARGERIAAHVANGMWHELSTIERYLETSIELMRNEGRDVESGSGSTVDAGADVGEAVLWENVHVEAGARLRRVVLGAGVRVARGASLENAAVVRAELVRVGERPAKALPGEVRGANFVVPLPQ